MGTWVQPGGLRRPLRGARMKKKPNIRSRVNRELCMLAHLRSLVPCQRLTEAIRQRRDHAGNLFTHRLRAVTGHSRAVLLAFVLTMARKRRKVKQDCESRSSLDQRPDSRAGRPQNQIAFPVAGHSTILHASRPLADKYLRCHKGLPATAGALSGLAQSTACAQTGGQLATKRTASLHVQGLVDRLMADAHGLVFREVDQQSACNLLRTPRTSPAARLPASMTTPLPRNLRSRNWSSSGRCNVTGQPVLDILSQLEVGLEFGSLRSSCSAIGVPLRGHRPILEPAAASSSITPQFTRNRRGRASKLPSDLPNAFPTRARQRQMLAFSKRQVPSRRCGRRRCEM
jgi:hypothetical protein